MSQKSVAIVLAGGKGSRMNMDIPKQYIEVFGKPILCYSLDAMENSFIDEIVVVVAKGEVDYFDREIKDKFGYKKIVEVVEGGKERYDSVYNGLCAIGLADYVFIHDGARPCIDDVILQSGLDKVMECGAAIAAVRAKDTIKVVDENGYITDTPDRNSLWQVQTPQVFDFNKIKKAYNKMYQDSSAQNITDDAMVMENYGDLNVAVYPGKYDNIKVTTTEDLEYIKNILKKI